MDPKGKYQNWDPSQHCLTDFALKCLIERDKMEQRGSFTDNRPVSPIPGLECDSLASTSRLGTEKNICADGRSPLDRQFSWTASSTSVRDPVSKYKVGDNRGRQCQPLASKHVCAQVTTPTQLHAPQTQNWVHCKTDK